nr:hypothetical protein [uncultured Oscillibacter sp.]
MAWFDQMLPQALMDANLADLDDVFRQTEDTEVRFSPRYLRGRMRLLADPWGWIERQERSGRRRLDWKLVGLAAALLLLSACAAAAFTGQFSQWFPWLGVNPDAPEASEDIMARMGTVIEQSRTADDMTVTLHAAVWDGETLRLSMTAEKPDMPEAWSEELWRGSWIYWEECRFSMRRDQLEDYTRREVESRYAEMELPPEKLEEMAQEQLAGDLFTFQQSFNLIRREGDKLFFEATLPLADYVERPELTLHIETLATYEEGKGTVVTAGGGERTGPGPDVVFLNGPYDFTFTLDKKLQPVIYEGEAALTAENIPLEVSRIKLTASAVEADCWSPASIQYLFSPDEEAGDPDRTYVKEEQAQAMGPQGLWLEDGSYVDFSEMRKSFTMAETLDGTAGGLGCRYPHVVDPYAVTAVNLGGTRVELRDLERRTE